MGTIFVEESALKPMDSIAFLNQAKTIKEFVDYCGPLDFIARIAVFMDGSKMSIEKGMVYKIFD